MENLQAVPFCLRYDNESDRNSSGSGRLQKPQIFNQEDPEGHGNR